MLTRVFTLLVALLALSLLDDRSASAEEYHSYVVPLQGRVYARLELNANLSKGHAFEPISLSPDLYVGVTNDFAVGIVHSAFGIYGVVGEPGLSLCLSGKGGGCDKVYPTSGLDLRWMAFHRGPAAFAINAGLIARDVDPFALAGKIGFLARYQVDRVFLEFTPNLLTGVTNRDIGNKELLVLPINLIYGHKPINVMLQVATRVPFDGRVVTGTSAMASYWFNKRFGLGAQFSLPLLIGAKDETLRGTGANRLDARTGALLLLLDI